jgi:hypothetical protein
MEGRQALHQACLLKQQEDKKIVVDKIVLMLNESCPALLLVLDRIIVESTCISCSSDQWNDVRVCELSEESFSKV